MYSGYGMRFDSAGSWSFDNDTARNVLIFCVDNSSSSYADNRKNYFFLSSHYNAHNSYLFANRNNTSFEEY